MRLTESFRFPAWALTFARGAVVLQVIHLVSLLVLANPLPASNVVQLVLPLWATAGCLYQWYTSQHSRQRRAWILLSLAFGLWASAEVSYLVELHFHLVAGAEFAWVDDVLWLLFAVPFLLVVSGSLEGRLNWVSWMDQIQAFIFFLVVVLLVYAHPSALSFNKAYFVQNVALLLSCTLRFSAAKTKQERRFFGRLAVYIAAYFLCAGIGNVLAHRGWEPGSLVDLFWTMPLTIFCVVVVAGQTSDRIEAREMLPGDGELNRYLHDLSALGLAALSMGSSVYLTLHWIFPGAICLASSFTFFAIRTCIRERDLHRANERLHTSALTDPLTGLGNRACLREYLNQQLHSSSALPQREKVAVLFVDLDRFKAINDGLGHDVGDKVLVEVAARIRSICQKECVACRLGGDEFVIAMEGRMAEQAEQVAAKLLSAIRTPLWLDLKVLQLSGSIGVAIASAEDGPDDLLRNADYAMYRAKRLGKNRVEVCRTSPQSKLHAGYMLETDLRYCLEHRQINVDLEPIYNLHSNDVCGFEALARWSHPELGMIPPSDFIPIAEETGMIIELGRQVLTQACREVVRWNKTWNTRLSLSVNISARQFSDPDLLSSVLETLALTGMEPHLLHLEITESVLLVGESAAAKVLNDAQQHGMEISLDDFGTGYSSLSYLLSFPTDEIKIDRSFVRGVNQDARRAELVRTVLQLGSSLKKRVVAEGVETREELKVLQEMGCRYVQGHLFGKPFPAESLHGQTLPTAAPALKDIQSSKYKIV